MIENFKNIEYLKHGNKRQKLAFKEINRHKIFEILKVYNPILTGTIPIGIDLPESDLDIICECDNHTKFKDYLTKTFSEKKDFRVYTKQLDGIESTIAEFKTDHFLFEIFGQNIPTEKQNAYRHMLIENRILIAKGFDFKQSIKKLKSEGLKTEPAFAVLLGLKGDPYSELFKYETGTRANNGNLCRNL
ncbi:DUF4269 domain-containing protein [Leeuwenhoekiella sp. W20_SRS_FM14]|uniref:DUF4269 domain-containing protein n=1 Tax=Leeuwenhoekiella sp. W20_SRS_FM14 TaxID=3240270 RepID=UPI003F9A325F